MAETLIPEVKEGRITGWVSKENSHSGEPIRHDANTCFILNGEGKILLAKRSNGNREEVESKRVGAGQWEGISTHIHRSDVLRYGIDPQNLEKINQKIIDLHKISVLERIKEEIAADIVQDLEQVIEEKNLDEIIDYVNSCTRISYLGEFQYIMDREEDSPWKEKELCRLFVLKDNEINPETTDEVMDFCWKDLSDINHEDMKSSSKYALWSVKAFKLLKNSLENNPK